MGIKVQTKLNPSKANAECDGPSPKNVAICAARRERFSELPYSSDAGPNMGVPSHSTSVRPPFIDMVTKCGSGSSSGT